MSEEDYNCNADENENENENEDIRAPDEPVREQLIPSSSFVPTEDDNYEKELQRALEASMLEYELEQQAIEEQMRVAYEAEVVRRREMFEEMLTTMKRISRYDTQIQEVLHIVGPIVEMFVEQRIDAYGVDEDVYQRIFGTMPLIRMKQENIELLQFLIYKKERNWNSIKFI